MYQKLVFKKDRSEAVIEPFELVQLAESIVSDYVKGIEAYKIDQASLALESQQKKSNSLLARLNQLMLEKINSDDDSDPREDPALKSALKAYMDSYKAEAPLKEKNQAADFFNHPLIPNYRALSQRLTENHQARQNHYFEQYAAYYGLTSRQMSEYRDYLKSPFDYHTLHGDHLDVWTHIHKLSSPLTSKPKPKQPLISAPNLSAMVYPVSIKGMKTVKDWMEVSLYLDKHAEKMPISGWTYIVSDRLISMRNRTSTEAGVKNRFRYANDHGTLKEYTSNLLSFYQNFAYDERMVGPLQALMSRWRGFGDVNPPGLTLPPPLELTHGELLKNMFIINVLFHEATTFQYESQIFLETFNDVFGLASLNEQEIKSTVLEFESIIAQTGATPERIKNISEDFHRILEVFFFVAQIYREHHATMYKISGGKSFYYQEIAKFMNKQDSDAFILCDLIFNTHLAIHQGELKPLYRPMDSYGDKYAGSSYTIFAQSIIDLQAKKPEITDAMIAAQLRSILKGEPLGEGAIAFLPNLVAVMYSCETSRIPRLMMTNNMLLDLFEEGSLDKIRNSPFRWSTALASENRIMNGSVLPHKEAQAQNKTCINLYGDSVSIETFDGFYPQAHHQSSGDQSYTPQGMSATRQKEAVIMGHWLVMMLKDKLKEQGIEVEMVQASPDPTRRENLKSIKSIYADCIKPNSTVIASVQKFSRTFVLNEYIIPAMKQRLETFDLPKHWNSASLEPINKIKIKM